MDTKLFCPPQTPYLNLDKWGKNRAKEIILCRTLFRITCRQSVHAKTVHRETVVY